ncbi:MAG TPA: hypothetical protein V6C96_05370, partial [Vampirovibrionales bacterium]
IFKLLPSIRNSKNPNFLESIFVEKVQLEGNGNLSTFSSLLRKQVSASKVIDELYGNYKYAITANGKLSKLNITKFKADLDDISLSASGDKVFQDLSAHLSLRGKDLFLRGVETKVAGRNKVSLEAEIKDFTEVLHKQNLSKLLENLVAKTEIRIRSLINPKEFFDFLSSFGFINTQSLNFEESINIPFFLKLKPKEDEINFEFSTNFYQFNIDGLDVKQAISSDKIEEISAYGNYKLGSGVVRLEELFYGGEKFGILANLDGKPENFNFQISSAPLIDLSELSKVWLNENAHGRFKGLIEAKNVNLYEDRSWLRNLSVEFHSEENVHDIQYGILYGKYFDFFLNTKDGNGPLKLTTKKGKVKNLQVVNLKAIANVENAEKLNLESISLESADGIFNLKGIVDLSTWHSTLTGNMKGVDVETVSNNLFENKGNYNGKGDLTYTFEGNFLDMLSSKPPDEASGEFLIKHGSLEQLEELSKNLHLANLVFGGPLNFSLQSIQNYKNPNGEGNFHFINGKWVYEQSTDTIHLLEANYTGQNSLHLKINGDWNFGKQNLDLEVYGFIPKRPRNLSEELA